MSADFWAGYISGAAGIIIGNPLDLIKTRLQAGKPAQTLDAASPPSPTSVKGNFENAGSLVRGKEKKKNTLQNPSNQTKETGKR